MYFILLDLPIFMQQNQHFMAKEEEEDNHQVLQYLRNGLTFKKGHFWGLKQRRR
jgi:hypothetical protein